MLDTVADEITQEVLDWSKAQGMAVENEELLLSQHVLRRLSVDCPQSIIKVIDFTGDTIRVFGDLPNLIDGDTDSPFPKRIGRIFTPIDETLALKSPSMINHIAFLDETIYLSNSNDFMTRLTYDNKIMFVPSIPEDNDDIYVEFLYPWTDIAQMPDAFRELVVYACRYEVVTQLINSMMFSNLTDSGFRGEDNSDGNVYDSAKSLLERCKNEYIEELDRIENTYNHFTDYQD